MSGMEVATSMLVILDMVPLRQLTRPLQGLHPHGSHNVDEAALCVVSKSHHVEIPSH